MLDDLLTPQAIFDDLWNRLESAQNDANSAFHVPAVASTNEIEGVTVRTVILRRCDRIAATLVFHTDRRSPKFSHLLQDPTVSWLFYDPIERLQIRVHTRATLHTQDAVANEQWTILPQRSREMYRTPLASGQVLPDMLIKNPPPSGIGRDNFAVVVGHIESIDWLYLHPDAHRRIRFWIESDAFRHEWLAP
jgi:hypothetical protein